MKYRAIRFPIVRVVPVLFAFPFLMGANGNGCNPGGPTDIGSGHDAGAGGVAEGGVACTPADCAGLGGTLEAKICPDGTSIGRTLCARQPNGQCALDFPPCAGQVTCQCAGPAPTTPPTQCPNGVGSGPVCATHSDGTCSWELGSCGPPGWGCPGIACFPTPNCLNGALKDSHGCDTCQCAPSTGCAPGVACQPQTGCGTPAPAGTGGCAVSCTCGAGGVFECQTDCDGGSPVDGGLLDAASGDAGCGAQGDSCCVTTVSNDSGASTEHLSCSGGLLCCIGVPYPTSGICHSSCPLVSDYHVKSGFEPVDVDAVLRDVASMSITTWKYNSEPSHARHMGPVAQEFHQAFGLGDSDRHIDIVDGLGVSLASIQALNRAVAELRAENRDLRAKNEELERAVRATAARPTWPAVSGPVGSATP